MQHVFLVCDDLTCPTDLQTTVDLVKRIDFDDLISLLLLLSVFFVTTMTSYVLGGMLNHTHSLYVLFMWYLFTD